MLPSAHRAAVSGSAYLSTGDSPNLTDSVDNISVGAPAHGRFAAGETAIAWLGCMVPKRHARRAVTRNLIKRQIRDVVDQAVRDKRTLMPGVWLVRLRAGFDRIAFPSAASDALRAAVRAELVALFLRPRPRAGKRVPGTPEGATGARRDRQDGAQGDTIAPPHGPPGARA